MRDCTHGYSLRCIDDAPPFSFNHLPTKPPHFDRYTRGRTQYESAFIRNIFALAAMVSVSSSSYFRAHRPIGNVFAFWNIFFSHSNFVGKMSRAHVYVRVCVCVRALTQTCDCMNSADKKHLCVDMLISVLLLLLGAVIGFKDEYHYTLTIWRFQKRCPCFMFLLFSGYTENIILIFSTKPQSETIGSTADSDWDNGSVRPVLQQILIIMILYWTHYVIPPSII